MCNDGNSAPHSVRYLNAQLASLYQNAFECVADCGENLNFKSAAYDKSKYTRSLAQYHYISPKMKSVNSTKELFFAAHFAQPQLTFICNHEAILYLTIKDGHYNLDYKRADSGARVEQNKNRTIENVTVAFRVKFSRTGIKGTNSKIGNGSGHLIQLMILDFCDKAKVVSTKPILAHGDADAVLFYMKSYLAFLEGAGHHVLFDLPDFDDDKYSPTIDYSVSTTLQEVDVMCSGETCWGVDVCEINDFLYKKWLSLARIIGQPSDQLSVCLAEISSSSLTNLAIEAKFHIQFGAPKVRALCNEEAIITFHLERIAFFHEDECHAPEQYEDWEISFIVDVKQIKECEGSVTKLILDLNTARFTSHFSTVFEADSVTETITNYFFQIVQFLSVDYLDILVQYKMTIVHEIDVRIIQVDVPVVHSPTGTGGHTGGHTDYSSSDHSHSDDESHKGSHGGGEGGYTDDPSSGPLVPRKRGTIYRFTEIIKKTVMYNYDQILAVSEESINQLFWSLWLSSSKTTTTTTTTTILYKWVKDIFSATFDSIKVRLLSNGKAIVWIKINEGELRIRSECEDKRWWLQRVLPWSPAAVTEKTEIHSFGDLTLAFEVDIKTVDQTSLSLHESFFSKFKETALYQNCDAATLRVFKHLILDFAHASYRSDLSNFECLCSGKGFIATEKIKTAIEYVQKYLVELSYYGHNIIHTLPVFKADCCHSQFAFTDVTHYVVTKTTITAETCRHVRKASEAPVILILGMTCGRPLKFEPPSWGSGWTVSTKGSLGSVALSKKAFLEGSLLVGLARINAMTTIVPVFAGVIDGEWKCELTTWALHDYRKGKSCHWSFEKSDDGYIHYIWEHRDGWSHEHEATAEKSWNGQYSIDCTTKNRLLIPTAYQPGRMEIKLTGESTLKVKSEDSREKWTRASAASWSASIFIYSRPSGLQVEVVGATKPKFTETVKSGDCCHAMDVCAMHKVKFPQLVNIDEVLGEIRATLQGSWKYSSPSHCAYALANPSFTATGDLVLQLIAHEVVSKKETVATPGTPVRKPQMFIKAPSAFVGGSIASGLLTTTTMADTPPIRTPSPGTPLLDIVTGAASSLFQKGSSSSSSSTKGGKKVKKTTTTTTTVKEVRVAGGEPQVTEKVEEHVTTSGETATVGELHADIVY